MNPDNVDPDAGGTICRGSKRDLNIAIKEYYKVYGLVPVDHNHVHIDDGVNSRDDWSALLVQPANLLPALQKLVELPANTNPPAHL